LVSDWFRIGFGLVSDWWLKAGHDKKVAMNIVLFTDQERALGVQASDPRVEHVRHVLGLADGQWFDAGVINGDRGKAKFALESEGRIQIQFQSMQAVPELYPVDVVVGLSRPQTCRFLLRSLASLGVRSIEFVVTDSGQRSYASSQLWTSGEYLQIVTSAVSQAFETKLPAIRFDRTLSEAAKAWGGGSGVPTAKICLDNYEATTSLGLAIGGETMSACLFIGSERGWSDGERMLIREHGFVMSSLGRRVLRVETAAVAAVSAVLANTFWKTELGTVSSRD